MSDPGPGARRIGISLGPLGLSVAVGTPPGSVPDLARHTEAAGLESFWTAENAGGDAFTTLAAAAAVTTELGVGTKVVPIYGRAPSVLAMEAASVHMLSGGRFHLGIGTSTRVIAEDWRNEPFDRPLTRLREYTEVLRGLLAGEKVTYDGRTVAIKNCRLLCELLPPPPIYLGAMGPRALALAGEIGDGVVLGLLTADGVRRAVAQVTDAARTAGRDRSDLHVVGAMAIAVDEDPDVLRPMAQRHAAFYLSVEHPHAQMVREAGFEGEVESFRRRWLDGDRRGATAAIPDRVLQHMLPSGTGDEVLAKIDGIWRAGVDTAAITLMTAATGQVDRLARFHHAIEALAAARRRLAPAAVAG